MAFQSPQHANCNALQQSLLIDILGAANGREALKTKAKGNKDLEPLERVAFIRVWMELEYLKREMRGIPRLRPCDIEVLLKRAKRALSNKALEPEEVEVMTEVQQLAESPVPEAAEVR
jgi:hypothetical protein